MYHTTNEAQNVLLSAPQALQRFRAQAGEHGRHNRAGRRLVRPKPYWST